MNDLKNKLLLKPRKEVSKEPPELKKWLNKFKEEREFDGIKTSTIGNDITRLKVFLNFVLERLEKSPNELTNADFVKFFNFLERERKLSRNTQNRYYQLLKVFYRLMRLENIKYFKEESQERKLFSGFEIKHYDAVSSELLNDIINIVVESKSRTKIRDATIIRFLWDSGCRISEALNLTYGDSDLEEGTFVLRNTKGNAERTVVCSRDTLDVINYYVQYNVKKGSKDKLFQNSDGEPIGRGWIGEIFRKAVDRLKKEGRIPANKKVVVHSLRHGRAVDLLEKGQPIDIVKEYLGHKSLDTTLFYSHSKERKEKMIKNIQKIL
jgi:integrase/recombinase XerD